MLRTIISALLASLDASFGIGGRATSSGLGSAAALARQIDGSILLRAQCRDSDVALIDFPLQRATITNMIDLALSDEQSRLVQLDGEITKAAATALLPFRGVW